MLKAMGEKIMGVMMEKIMKGTMKRKYGVHIIDVNQVVVKIFPTPKILKI